MPYTNYYGHAGWVTVCVLGAIFLGVVVWVSFTQLNRDYNDSAATHWALVGNLTATTVSFRIRNNPETMTQSLFISTFPTFASPISTISIIPSITGDLVQSFTIDNLQPQTQYYYRLSTPGASTIFQQGKFRTPAPAGQAFDFKIVTAGCAWSFSDNLNIYDEMAKEDADLFVHLGDLHYEDIDVPDMDLRINAIDKVLGSPSQRPLFTVGGLVYMWDDHDWTGNDSTGETASQEARDIAMQSYQLAFPHYSLALGGLATVPVYHAFTYGTVRFIVSDLRSQATSTQIYSSAQRDWLFNELSKADQYDWVIWITTRPWIQDDEIGADTWGGFSTDRAELSSYISATLGGAEGPQNLLAISADAHMIAMDNGLNTFYGTREAVLGNGTDILNGNNDAEQTIYSFPVLVSGPMDRLGSSKGGPYTEGCHATKYHRNHQYSTLQFSFDPDDDGNATGGAAKEPCIDVNTYRINRKGEKERIFRRQLCGQIFVPVQQGVKQGSCDIQTFDKTDVVLFSLAAGVWFVLTLVACWQMGPFMSCITMSFVLIFFVGILALGVYIPIRYDVSQFNTFPLTLTAFGFVLANCMGLGCIMCIRYRRDRDEDHRYADQVRRVDREKQRRKNEREANRRLREQEEARRQRRMEQRQQQEEEDEYLRARAEEEERRQKLDRARSQPSRSEYDYDPSHSGERDYSDSRSGGDRGDQFYGSDYDDSNNKGDEHWREEPEPYDDRRRRS